MEFIPSEYKQWAKNNILINNIRLGVVNTKIHKKIKNKSIESRKKMIPIGRMAEINEVNYLITHLLSSNNSYVTGQTISISGGE